MRLGLVVLIVLTVACTQGGQSAVKTASPTPVSSPVQSPSPAASPLAPPGDLPVSQVSFSCRLPIYMQTGYETSPDFSRQGAFITFPSASMAIDPSGKAGAYFDLAFKRWLPVRREDVSPDGTHYAYVGILDNLLHVVNVTDGKERIFSLDAVGDNYVFAYASEGIYMTFGFEGLHGLSLVDPNTGASRPVPQVMTPGAIGAGGVVWFSEVNPADPRPINTASSAGILSDQVTRIDVKSGTKTPWLYRPGVGLSVVGLDAHGHPLINVVNKWMDPSTDLLIAPDPTSQKTILTGPLVGTLGGSIADSHGVWFDSPQGIYLYTEAGGLQKVSNQPGFLANGCF